MLKPAIATAFIGRQRELETLERKLELAFAGHGGIAMLVGEAGVGKTWVAQEFSARAAQRGAVVLAGACYEGDWRPPYGPFIEALGEYARTSDPQRLREQLGGGGPYLAHLVPEIRAALPDLPLPQPLGPDDGRLRLFDAVRQSLLASTREGTLVLVLDDLHWADRDSLLLLRHLARFVGQTRLLIVGAYRDAELELERQHPLADLLAVLHRETDHERVAVRPFSFQEVAEYLAQAAGQPLPQALAQAIYDEASGNPFYVREVFRNLVEEGKLLHRAGRWSTDTSIAELRIPEGVRQVIDRRVSHLSQETGVLLRTVAGLAGGFEFPLLRSLTDLTEDSLLDCLDEALQAGLLRVSEAPAAPPAYSFAHAIVRHALYDGFKPDRRARLHRRIALAMEKVYAGRELEHAAELAWQYWSSAGLPGAEKGLGYALTAAEQARAEFALEQAVSYLRMARGLAGEGALAARADILGRLAVAEAEAVMLEDAQRTVEEALDLLSRSGAEPSVGANLLASVVRALKDGGAGHAIWEPLVERGLALVGERRDLAWARLTLLLEHYEQVSTGMINAGRWLGLDPKAMAIARASGEEDDYAQALDMFAWRTRAETEAILDLVRVWQRPSAVLTAVGVAGRDFLYRQGDFAKAIYCFGEMVVIAERYGSIPAQGEALYQLAVAYISLGDLPQAREALRRMQEVIPRLGAMARLRFVETEIACGIGYYLEADWPRLAAAASRFVASPEAARGPIGPIVAVFGALAYARAGNPAEARRLLECLTPIAERTEPRTLMHNATVAMACAVIWELGADDLAATYRRMTLELIEAGVGYLLLPHELGIARMAALLGRTSEAAEYVDRVRDNLGVDCRSNPLLAIVDYDEALSLARMGVAEAERIAALLGQALSDFAEMGMVGWVERARALLEKMTGEKDERRASRQPRDGVLTPREVEVVRLVARGKTNKEIAADLVLSLATVERHITSIYAKIDARGRADATAYAYTHGLVEDPA